jgi:hypothetical protein
MAVLLAFFDTRIGPVSFITLPPSFNENIVKRTVKLMDFMHEANEFFLQEYPEDGIKSINLSIEIPSKWARGKRELLQITIFSTEETPPVDLFKQTLNGFRQRLFQDPDIYMAFYKGNRMEYIHAAEPLDPEKLEKAINEKYEILAKHVEWLNNQARIDTPNTYAYLTAVGDIAAMELMRFPKSALNELKELARSKNVSSVFAVFRKIGDMMKVDIIPTARQVIKVRIIVKELTPELIMRTSQIIALPLLFTSGICQEKAGKCSYEAYFAVSDNVEETAKRVSDGLGALTYVESVEITTVVQVSLKSDDAAE